MVHMCMVTDISHGSFVSMYNIICCLLKGNKHASLAPQLCIFSPNQVQGFEVARLPFGRVQRYRGTIDCFITIFRQEGLLAFYKGTSIALMKVTSSSAIRLDCKLFSAKYVMVIQS